MTPLEVIEALGEPRRDITEKEEMLEIAEKDLEEILTLRFAKQDTEEGPSEAEIETSIYIDTVHYSIYNDLDSRVFIYNVENNKETKEFKIYFLDEELFFYTGMYNEE